MHSFPFSSTRGVVVNSKHCSPQMDCTVDVKPLPEFALLSKLHYMTGDHPQTEGRSLDTRQRNSNAVYPDEGELELSDCDIRNSHKKSSLLGLAWGEDILFLDHELPSHGVMESSMAGGVCCDLDMDEDNKMALHSQLCNDVQNGEKVLVSLGDISEMGEPILAGFNAGYFHKEEENEDLNDICSTLQMGGMHESQTCMLEEVQLPATPEEPAPSGGRPGLRRTRNASRRFSLMGDDAASFCSQTESYGKGRRRNSSEHSGLSNGSYEDPDSPSNNKRKRRRYEEEPSDDPAFEKSRKNAIIAKRNREKKKLMMEQMESNCDVLTTQNKKLDSENRILHSRVVTLEEEVHYLKSVLANQSALADVLSHLKPKNGEQIRFTSSFDATVYKKSPPSISRSNGQMDVSGGICLHVDGSQVSMEMCAKCAQMARGASRSAETSSGRMTNLKRKP